MKKIILVLILGIIATYSMCFIKASSSDFIPTKNYNLLSFIPKENFINTINNDYPTTAVKIGHLLTQKSNLAFKISFYAKNTQFLKDYQNKTQIGSYFYSLDTFDSLKEHKDIKKINDRMFYLQSTDDYEFVLMDSGIVIDCDGGFIALEVNEQNQNYFDLNLFIGDLYGNDEYLENLVVHVPNPNLQTDQIFIQELKNDKTLPVIISPQEEIILTTSETFNFNDFINKLTVQDNENLISTKPYLYTTNYDEITQKIPGDYYAIFKARDYSFNETTFQLKIKVILSESELKKEQGKKFFTNLGAFLKNIGQMIKKNTERFISILKRMIA